MGKNSRGNRGRGGPSNSPSPFRGRGGPSGSGYNSRGGTQPNKGRGTFGSSFLQDELDFTLHMYADSPNPPQSSSTANEYKNSRGRGRGRGFNNAYRGSSNYFRGNGRGKDYVSANREPENKPPYERGRGRGEGTGYSPRHGRGLGASTESTPTKPGPKSSSFSNLLTRPFLRPINFVRAEHNPFLFQEEEEILQPIAEEAGVDEASHVPTAGQVERIFSGATGRFDNSDSYSSSEGGEEEIEEVDFNDMGRLFDPPKPKPKQNSTHQNRNTDINMECSRNQIIKNGDTESHSQPPSSGNHDGSATEHPLFVIDTQPAPLPSSLDVQEPEDDEEIIVYVAPHPKISSRAPSRMQEDSSIKLANSTSEISTFVPYTPSATLSLASKSLRDLSPPPPPQSMLEPEQCSVPIPSSSPRPKSPGTSLPILSVQNLKFKFSSSQNGSTKNAVGRQLPSVMTPGMTKRHRAWERQRAKRGKARNNERRGSLAAFGAMVNDARLYDDEAVLFGDSKDPKWELRRRGDSDVEWGTEDEVDENADGEVVDEVPRKSEKAKGKEKAVPQEDDVEADHGMQVDAEMDVAAMKNFASGLMGRNAGVHVTMEDLHIEERIRIEDAKGANGGAEGSSEDEDVEGTFDLQERLMIGDSDDEDSDDEDSDDESEDEVGLTPKSSFQVRLDRLRAKSKSYKQPDAQAESDESDDDEDLRERNLRWAEDDDDDELLAQVEDILEANVDILRAHDRKGRKKSFHAIQNGNFADVQPARKRKDQWKDIPKELQEVWKRDRQAKAERKLQRELEKLMTSVDPLSKKKGGKKGRKTMVKASSLDSATINLGPNRVIDFTTLVQQIRRFVDNLGGPQSMSLPPANKWTRKNVHEVALAFGLDSYSKGHGDARYTTLTKTTKTGYRVNERKIAVIMRRFGGEGSREGDFEFRGLKGTKSQPPKHREGEEVGGSAPKIGQSNLGFKMLASMGWAEGERIGLSGGLKAPLVAIIKHTKLGLGAMK